MSVRQYTNLLNKIHIEKAPPAVVLFLHIKGVSREKMKAWEKSKVLSKINAEN